MKAEIIDLIFFSSLQFSEFLAFEFNFYQTHENCVCFHLDLCVSRRGVGVFRTCCSIPEEPSAVRGVDHWAVNLTGMGT